MTDRTTPRGVVRTLGGANRRRRLSTFLDCGDHLLGGLRPLVGPDQAIVVDVTNVAGATGDRAGAGPAEVRAVRLRRGGVPITRESSRGLVRTRAQLSRLRREQGWESVVALREDPSLLTELQVGAWFVAGWRARSARRFALALPVPVALLPLRLAADVAFWTGVREEATAREWRRLTASSYVVLCYHRLTGRAVPGQERMDVAPQSLRRQLRALRLLGWRPISAEEVLAFHRDPEAVLPRRRYVLTADDGFHEAVRELTRVGRNRPQIFVVTGAVGGRADWLDNVSVAGWEDLERLVEAGGLLGSHARHHLRLDRLDDAAVRDEVAGSLADLRAHHRPSVDVLAYPHGGHDLRVRAAAREAGYDLAYTTRQGRNGAGTDRWCLRRVEPKIWDSSLSFAWKVLTGESPRGRWERRLERRWRKHRGA